jgi:hypothetical protein
MQSQRCRRHPLASHTVPLCGMRRREGAPAARGSSRTPRSYSRDLTERAPRSLPPSPP